MSEIGSSAVHIPNLVLDPAESMASRSIRILVGGQAYEIPALPARDWLAVLMDDEADLADIFPGLVDGDQNDIADELAEAIEGGVDPDEVDERIPLAVIERAAGRKWWVALRLIGSARASWQIIGAELTLRGVDASRISLSAWLDVVLLIIMRNIDPKDATMFALKLELPPPELAQEEPEPEMSAQAFLAIGAD